MSQHPQLQNLTAPEAYALIQEQGSSLLIDIRTKMEFQFVGHPVGAIHIPWKEVPGWKHNPEFTPSIAALLEKAADSSTDQQTPIILMCRSGSRTVDAGNALIDAGFENVYHITDGFEGDLDHNAHRGNINGWRFHGLPWQQS